MNIHHFLVMMLVVDILSAKYCIVVNRQCAIYRYWIRKKKENGKISIEKATF